MKKTSDFSRLMGYAGRYRVFTYASWVLSAISALTALVPFLYIWMILRDVLAAAPDYAQAVNIPHYGWMAVLFAVLSYLIYIAALMCSHLSAFRVATNLRLAVSEHLAVLPLGFAENFGSGKLRKIIHESTGAAETYLAHQLPDQYNAIATPVGLLVLLLAFDWRLGLLSLAPVVLAFLIMATMTGKRMVEKMRQYHRPSDAHRSWGGQNRGAVRRCGGRTGRTRCTLCPERPVHPHGGSADRKPALGHLTQFKNSPSAQQKRTSIRKNRCPF